MQADVKIVKQMPRLYVVSDGKTIVAVDPKEQDVYENEVALMWKDFDFFYPLAGIEKIRNVEEADADVKSAELMAKIYDEIRKIQRRKGYDRGAQPQYLYATFVVLFLCGRYKLVSGRKPFHEFDKATYG